MQASESIRKEYEKKCDELRHQFAKDLKPHLIDKTRAVAKDLHSRMKVALHTVDSISKRIEKMHDEELQPQLMELIQGMMRMWKSMLECHHAQYLTANYAKNTRTQTRTKNPVIIAELEHEVERFWSSFSDLVKSYTYMLKQSTTGSKTASLNQRNGSWAVDHFLLDGLWPHRFSYCAMIGQLGFELYLGRKLVM